MIRYWKAFWFAFAVAAGLTLFAGASLAKPRPPAPFVLSAQTRQRLARIGTWNGRTRQAALRGPYVDLLQQQIPFGARSFYLNPWRAYMDTWPASQYLNCLGINFNVNADQAWFTARKMWAAQKHHPAGGFQILDRKYTRRLESVTAQVLAEAGIGSARLEIGWGSLSYRHPSRLNHPTAARVKMILRALKAADIRPLILLNANSGFPCPIKFIHVRLTKLAKKGARRIRLADVSAVRPGYTGFRGMAYPIAFPLITAVAPETGICQLSAPLPKAVPAGPLILATLKYHPFSGAVLANGQVNPFAQQTLNGWRQYVATVCATVQKDLGTVGKPNAGFDLEVWNEYTFGSQFLDEANYYQPARIFKTPISYHKHGLTRTGVEIILPLTVDYVNNPAHHLPGVRVISGFSNERPWENGATLWPGQTGFSRHYYTGLNPYHWFDSETGVLCPPAIKDFPNQGPINALGLMDGKRTPRDWNSVVPGSFFVPTEVFSMPEQWFFGDKTENIVRDLQPFPGPFAGHYRYSNPGDGRAAQVWETEYNTWRWPWLQHLMKVNHLKADNPRLIALSQEIGAKALLRALVFQSSKGVHTIEVFAVQGGDLGFDVIPHAFFTALAKAHYRLTPRVRALIGPQLTVLRRVYRLMRIGQPLAVTRPLQVTRLVEHHPRLVQNGNGTPAHPALYNRADFACLPFQLAANRYAVGYYVVTRDMVQTWRKKLSPLDPDRYNMPPQRFDLTLSNIRGPGAKVYAWDPMTNQKLPAPVLAATTNTLTVRLATVDYPRFLLIRESRSGPLIEAPRLTNLGGGRVRVRFQTNMPVRPTITWGPLPGRGAGRAAGTVSAATLRPAVPGGRATLPLGRSFVYTIRDFKPGQGVRVVIQEAGLTCPWPRWGYSTAGVLWPRPTNYARLPKGVWRYFNENGSAVR